MPTVTMFTKGVLLLLLGCYMSTVAVSGDACQVDNPIKEDSGSISVTLKPKTTCTWDFAISGGKNVYLVVDQLVLAPGDVAVFFSKAGKSEVLTVTGTKSSFVVVLPSNGSSLVLNSTNNSLDVDSHLQLNYTTSASDCKMDVKNDAAEIRAPYFSNPLPGSGPISCKYSISASSDRKTQVWSFESLDLKGDLTFNSANKTKTFKDGDTRSPDLLFNDTKMAIDINMSTSVNQTGFVASYAFLDVAPQNETVTSRTLIISPGYPYRYMSNEDARWFFTAPDGYVRISLDHFDLSDASDSLKFVDGDSLYGRQLALYTGSSGNVEGNVLLSGQSSICIQFTSSAGQKTGKGFTFTLTSEKLSKSLEVSDSPQFFNLIAGTSLPETETITYQMSAPLGERVQAMLNESSLLEESNVTFYDGWNISNAKLATFSNGTSFYPVVSPSNKMLMVVNFRGDSTNQSVEGYIQAAPKSERYEILTDKQGNLQFDATNPPSAAVAWVIQNVDINEKVSLNIKQVSLPKNVSLIVHEGPSETDEAIVKLGTDSANVKTFPTIKADRMRVELIDDRTENDLMEDLVHFDASYGIESVCKASFGSDVSSGQITTPGFPNQYPYNELCQWELKTDENSIVRVSFDAFDVYSEHKFTVDATTSQNETIGNSSVIVNDTTTILSASGEDIPDDLIVTGIFEMTMTFDSEFNHKTDDYHVGQGVKANFEYMSCGGNMTADNGTLSSPGYPAKVSGLTNCVWVVTLPPSKDNSTSILKMKLNAGIQGNDPSINTLMIRDGGSKRAPAVSANLTEGQEVMSRTNIIWVEYVFDPANTKSKGFPFQLNYTTYACPKSQQCKNGICMHPDWKCDGYDQCGDHTDEDDCTCVVSKKGAVSYVALAMSILATFVAAVLITIAAPFIYRKIRYSNYNELRDFMTPVPT